MNIVLNEMKASLEQRKSTVSTTRYLFFDSYQVLGLLIVEYRIHWVCGIKDELKEELDTFKSPDFIQLVNRLNELEREYDYLANYSSYHQRCQSIILERQNLKEWN